MMVCNGDVVIMVMGPMLTEMGTLNMLIVSEVGLWMIRAVVVMVMVMVLVIVKVVTVVDNDVGCCW